MGEVVRHQYREPAWPEWRTVPYQVKLDSGMTIIVPYDEDDCIRKAGGILSYGRIPVTVLTGFLGAGKTTLLNYILGAQHGRKYAVIENEFGDVAIDEMLVSEAAGHFDTLESIALLGNGCLCCSLREDLVTTISGIIEKVEQRLQELGPSAMIDGILIETTGLADPGPICQSFSLDATLKRHCEIDGVLTLVDALHFPEQLRRPRPTGAVNEPARQVAFADKILLNKVDAAGEAKMQEALRTVRGVNGLAPVLRCNLADDPSMVPVGELLGIDAFDPSRLLAEDVELDMAASHSHEHGSSHGHGHGHGHSHSHSHTHVGEVCTDPGCTEHQHEHRHDTDIGTMVLELEDVALDVRRFQAFLDDLLAGRSKDLYRYKGVLAVRQGKTLARYVLQGVHDSVQLSFSGEWPQGTPLRTQVVLIGRQLAEQRWRKEFAACAEGGAVA